MVKGNNNSASTKNAGKSLVIMIAMRGMVQAWVSHFVTPITLPLGYSLVLVYI
jgi:hypothetical protein